MTTVESSLMWKGEIRVKREQGRAKWFSATPSHVPGIP